MFKTFRIFPVLLIVMLSLLTRCKQPDPIPEDIPELITKATLTFTPVGGGASIVVTATDPDNIGSQDIIVDGSIDLLKGTSYTLSVKLVNALFNDISTEVEEEGVEHQFFFAWTEGIFSDPSGDGNIDNRDDPLNYGSSVDINGRPIGLTTSWTASQNTSSGNNSFRILLKHQPDIKSDISTSEDGESDLDLTFVINIK